MNRGGVALAADSAVTIQSERSPKVRDSALKLFMLSKYRPVGVMVYNNAVLLGVPMETLIKLFRQHLGRTEYAKLHEYGDALVEFLKFLNRNDLMFPLKLQDEYFFAALEEEYERIAKAVIGALSYDLASWSEEKHVEAAERILREKIDERLEFWESQDKADYFNVNASEFVGRQSGRVHDLIRRTFLFLKPIEIRGEANRAMYAIAEQLVTKDYFPPDIETGLVIAGFGEEEHFPVVQHLRVGGIFDNQLKVRPGTIHEVSEDKPSQVLSFAYQDMVRGFLGGIFPDVRQRTTASIRRGNKIGADEFEGIVRQEADKRRSKIEQAIEVLSLKELAHVASTLMNLSSFEHQMSREWETVGGPVDVAVISKGDGFIWINRKHYFRPELNSHFFKNYFDDGKKLDNTVAGSDEQKDRLDG